MSDALPELLGYLALQSLLAIGGVSVILGELHRMVVVSTGWLTATEFATLFALAQAAPGPNMLFVTLIGWSMGGVLGAVAATIAFLAPAVLLAGAVARMWGSWQDRGWFVVLRRGLVPLTVGLIAGSAILVANAAAAGWTSYAITAAATAAVLVLRLHPVLILGIAAALGAAGVI